ncbi:unnamed protein product [Owenia fusiformis]|uniref:Uncharacterized protein n=1 Tax=Owenia fusiformis TaxID=6347 RepID=A0A8S4NHV7_OWEFU|nr:unnamed protein product [Owenia fusiformis]
MSLTCTLPFYTLGMKINLFYLNLFITGTTIANCDQDIFKLKGNCYYETKLAGFEVCNFTNVYWSRSTKVEEGSPTEKAHFSEMLSSTHRGNVVFVINMALHVDLKTSVVQTFIKTILTHVQHTYTDRKFYMFYFPPYIPGLLKPQKHVTQQAGPTLEFTNIMKKFVMDNNIKLTFLNPQMLMKDAISYDGTHYTQGLNEAMFQIIMNYLNYSQM